MRKSKKIRREFLEILSFSQRFLPKKQKYVINIAYKTGVELTPRTKTVAQAFGLGVDEDKSFVIYDNFQIEMGEKDIIYVTGDSGSGKSVLLKKFHEIFKGKTIDMNQIRVDADKPIIDTVGKSFEEAIELLSRAGLNDAFIFLRKFNELSDGQKYRYKLAKLLESKAKIWVCDEFCSLLDRETAKIVAYNIQKHARRSGKGIFVATCHTDLLDDLKPTIHIHKGFGRKVTVKYYNEGDFDPNCTVLREIRIEEGCKEDYAELAEFHYRSHRVPVPRKFFKATKNGRIVGIIAYSFPPFVAACRRKALGTKLPISKLNEVLSCITRVVVHPKYRGIGLGQKLVRETLPKCGTPFVETIAVMAKYNPFFEKAGMKKVCEQKPAREIIKIVSGLLNFGFNQEMIVSRKYNLKKLMELPREDVSRIRKLFVDNPHPRLVKQAFHKRLFAGKRNYEEAVRKASLEKLASLIRTVGLLFQTKVYLFWRNPNW